MGSFPAKNKDTRLKPLQQARASLDPRPRLSASQQTQILSDVQQQFDGPATQQPSEPASLATDAGAPFSSLARYKVDRKKPGQQQLQEQLQGLQQRVQQHQSQGPIVPPLNYQQHFANHFGDFQPQQPGFLDEPRPQPNPQLAEFYEKQRQLEILQRQREQLLLEQQELRRQQELLRLQQLQLRSTLLPSSLGTPFPVSGGPATTTPTTTTTTTTQTTTTSSGVLLSSPTARKITASENDIFLRAIATHQKKYASTQKPVAKQSLDEHHHQQQDILALIQNQQQQQQQGKKPQIKLVYQTDKPTKQTSDRELLLRQLKLALAQSGTDDRERNVTTRDVVLPNGKRLQVIHAPNGLPSTTTTIKPAKAVLDELTKGVVPPGADFEVLRQSNDGKLEDLGKNPLQNQPAKKVTFVVLEEQPDGSYKVQGVKGNVEKEAGTDVDSIVERIKKGEIKLPPSSTTQRQVASSTTSTTMTPTTTTTTERHSTTYRTTFRPTLPQTNRGPLVSVSPNSVASSDKYVTSASSISSHALNSISTTAKPSHQQQLGVNHVTLRYPSSSPFPVSSNGLLDTNEIFGPTTPASNYFEYNTSPATSVVSASARPTSISPSYANSKESLSSLLRREGLFAMAKYLRQSGLDTVLNETGPYTIFVPTDKAFRTLLVQLGGPEKAEQKFRDNPRLLSGLLLHHVVPGAFRIDSLQDEMTGVSLAGTQLRVNVYQMHDHEWNDIQVTTINGARVAPNKRDVEVPQGLAHAIDRVMFPLPVGDLVQTLQADRERRFSGFLKILHASNLEEMLSGAKTFTVFAPTDAALAEAAVKNAETPIWQESDGPDAAKELVLRHVIPTTLYTAGMRYYHQKDSLREQAPIQIQKTGGRIRVNEGHIVTYNVPATNGVLHAIDTVL
ncbi:mediator of RNA polymerase II transcription subunit 15 [Copidosoma floridanum]|uniref:mediator of RNA polymerase II transcription subunit 15 n=1 Tax=Copidosoma floridanum TaxID=29053 RepID=UPI0006C9E550|nr:mediator of RNA polymerase II transcription subunit 15 [Copidosoma floridanum]